MRKTTERHLIAIALAVLATFLNLRALSAQLRNDAQPVQIGMILPLTGPLAEYGAAVQNGVELARSDVPEIASNCSFKVEDSKYDPKTAVGALQKLVTVDAVPIVYNWGGPTSDALAPLAERNNMALFVWSADPGVSEGRPQVIRFCNSGYDYGETLVRYLEAQRFHKIGIVKTDNQYIDAILAGVQAAAKNLEIRVVDNYLPADQDFRATVSKLKTQHFDALGVFLLSGQVAQFATQLKAQSVSLPLFGTDFFESLTEVRRSNGGLQGAVFSNNEVTETFRNAYVQRFGNDLQINHAANGYDFAKFVCHRLGQTLAGVSAQEIIRRATEVKSFEGQQGSATFTTSPRGDKYFKFPVVIRRIEADAIVTEGKGG